MTDSKPLTDGAAIIADESTRQLRSALEDFRNTTGKERSLARLRTEVKEEYRGRAVLELLQNAYDQRSRETDDGDGHVVRFELDTEATPCLRIANTGRAFTRRDFEGIARIAASTKDPKEAVGNKGLGFRSVFEFTKRPRIWSLAPDEKSPAFCFGLSPDVHQRIAEKLAALASSPTPVRSPFCDSMPMLDWGAERIASLWDMLVQVSEVDEPDTAVIRDLLDDTISPYNFPLGAPLSDASDTVQRLLDDGFVTVVELPLDESNAVASARDQLNQLDASSVLFLDGLARLELVVDGVCRTVNVDVTSHVVVDDRTNRQDLEIHHEGTTRRWMRWMRRIGGADDVAGREAIRGAAAKLDEEWRDLDEVTVSLAVPDSPDIQHGRFVVFLPTERSTGTGAWMNARFMAKMGRTQINFDVDFNRLQLDALAQLSADAIRDLCTGSYAPTVGRAVFDILGSGERIDGLGVAWCDHVFATDPTLLDEPIVGTHAGWRVVHGVRDLARVRSSELVTYDEWVDAAPFDVFDARLADRLPAFKRIASAATSDVSPSPREWRALASALVTGFGDAGRTSEFRRIFHILAGPLFSSIPAVTWSDIPLIPTVDGRIVPPDGEVRLFLAPAEAAEDRSVLRALPGSVARHISFVHPDVMPSETAARTSVTAWLKQHDIGDFDRREVLRAVRNQLVANNVVALDSDEGQRCRDALAFALEVTHASELTDRMLTILSGFRIPCFGGWFTPSNAVLGAGWGRSLGDALASYACALDDLGDSWLHDRTVVPRDHPAWHDIPVDETTLSAVGVVEGLPLRTWDGYVHGTDCQNRPPDGAPEAAWQEWAKAIHNQILKQRRHYGRFSYRLTNVSALPGWGHWHELSGEIQTVASRLILHSLRSWSDWDKAQAIKTRGQDDRFPVHSPVRTWLAATEWLDDGGGAARPLHRRWYVPSRLLRGAGRARYSHLTPLSTELAQRLESDEALHEGLRLLGLRRFPQDGVGDGRALVERISETVASTTFTRVTSEALRSQLHAGWRTLGSSTRRHWSHLPKRVVINDGGELDACSTDKLIDVFLPHDAKTADALIRAGKPVLEIAPEDAATLADELTEAWRVTYSANLEPVLRIDGDPFAPSRASGERIADSPYAWLPPALLTVAAWGGTAPSGSETQAWDRARRRLRSARIVTASSLQLDLEDETGAVLATMDTAAYWFAGTGATPGVLVVHENLHERWEDAADVFEDIIDRKGLHDTLVACLLSLNGAGPAPHRQEIVASLERVRIRPDQYADVETLWLASAAEVADRLRPGLMALGLDPADFDTAPRDLDQIRSWLRDHVRPTQLAPALVDAARHSTDDAAFGRRLFALTDGGITLPAFNAALAQMTPPRTPVTNSSFESQLRRHRDDLQPTLWGLLRWTANACDDSSLVMTGARIVAELGPDASWASTWWDLPFSVWAGHVREALHAQGITSTALDALSDCRHPSELEDRLRPLGPLDLRDPDEVTAENQRRCDEARSGIRELLDYVDAPHGRSAPLQGLEAAAAPGDRDLSDAEAFAAVWGAIADHFDPSLASIDSLDALRAGLGIDEERVQTERAARAAAQEAKRRKERSVAVAGVVVDPDAVDLAELCRGLPELPPVLDGSDARADRTAALATLPPVAGARRRGANRKGQRAPKRLTDGQRRTIGGVGEYLAFEYLKRAFGVGVVTRKAWVSELRRLALPFASGENDGHIDDGLGADFVFTHEGRRVYVEVKSTTGDACQFELGQSEFELAKQVAHREDEIWRVLHVTDLASSTPAFRWLTNPFAPGNSAHFQLPARGVRVRYELADDA